MARAAAALTVASWVVGASWGQESSPDLTTMGLEELMEMEVTSVSKKPEKLMDTPAAVRVITAEEIRRSGATSITELLRFAAGVQVARTDSSGWAIGVRGFTSSLSRSLLVLIDGRSVYSPLFAGVYWDTQDVVIEDIDRIEVIRGPGATVWGSNAVNGVINVITKSAKRTQGSAIAFGAGNQEQLAGGVRSGWETSQGTAMRAYAKYFDRDAEFHHDGDEFDQWDMTRAGFRADGALGERDRFTVQGNVYDGRVGDRATLATYTAPYSEVIRQDSEVWGGNLLGRWTRPTSEASDITVDLYYDRTYRNQPGFSEDRDTVDLEFRHGARLGFRHELLWGAGYRVTDGDAKGEPAIQFVPENRRDDVVSAFVQDEIQVLPSKLVFTIGSKFEHNDYSGFNYQPSIRVLFSPVPGHAVWSAVSRALRVPSRVETDLLLTALVEPSTPTFVRLIGTDQFKPERLTAYELGYRVQPTKALFLDVALFYNEYDRLLSVEMGTPFTETSPPPSHTVVPFTLDNRMEAHVWGAELAYEWRPFSKWLISGSYSWLEMNLFHEEGSNDVSTETSTEGSSPRHMASIRSLIDLPHGLGLSVGFRHVGSLPSQQVRSYTEMDITVSRHLTQNLDLTVSGRNLLSSHHAEFAGGQPDSVEISRSIHGRLAFRW
ncbi:MAG TPA: TonB-dependent receptor [Candidatus Polarisedimenticolia bacterium]|nr:TonB-dependent receptor [Candidatus Polarisedimenticolia bacterium]